MASKMKHEGLQENSFSEESEAENDSDLELQQALASGQLKPGLSHVIEKETKNFINKVPEMKEKLEQIKLDMDWLEKLDVTCNISEEDDNIEAGNTTSARDDFKREMRFYQQAQIAVAEALPKLKKLCILATRPADYFAEMVKTDDHMQKVRQKLVTKEMAMERSEKAKKLREMKKFGKKVQQEVLQKRQQEKKKMIESVKKFRKGQKGKPQFMQDDEEFEITTVKGTKRPHAPGKQAGKSFKRQKKDVKYGFGGKKRTMKRNTTESTDDVSSFNSTKHSKPPRGKKLKTKNKRPGKSRRQAMKGKGK